MKIYKVHRVIAAALILLCAGGVISADKAGALKLAEVKHNYACSGETLQFVFRDAAGGAPSALPHTVISYSADALNIRLTLDGTAAGVDNVSIEGALVSSIEAQTVRDKTVVYVFLKKPVRYYVRRSLQAGTMTLGIYDADSGGFWVRVDSPVWRSRASVYPFWDALKKAAILTCLLQGEDGNYFLATMADSDTAERAEISRKAIEAVVDDCADSDLMQIARPLVTVGTIADMEGDFQVAAPPPDVAKEIDAAVANLAKDPAIIDAVVRDKIISPSMRAIIKTYGEKAVPSLAIAAASKDVKFRRTVLLTLAAIGGKGVGQFLVEGLSDPEPVVRQEMLLALERVPATRAVLMAVKRELDDKDKWSAFFAARILAKSWFPEAVPVLLRDMGDEELRDEAASIIQQYVTTDVSSEMMAGLSPDETKATIDKFLAKWEADKEFLSPPPSDDVVPDMLTKIFTAIYPDEKVSCTLSENSKIEMEHSGAQGTTVVSVLQFLPCNLDADAASEAVVLVGGENGVPVALAAVNGEDGTGDALWAVPLGAEAASAGARAYLTDIDGDGAAEVVLAAMNDKDGVRTGTLTIYRTKEKTAEKVYSTEFYKKTNPREHLEVATETRAFMRYGPTTERMRPIILDTRVIRGEGTAALVQETSAMYVWTGKGYELSSEKPAPPTSETVEAAGGEDSLQTGGATEHPKSYAPGENNVPPKQPEAKGVPPAPTQTGVAIIAVKSDKKLYLYVDGKLFKAYDAKFGAVEGDKEIEGDMKTPEGEFYVCLKNPNSRYHLSMGLSYPNKEDAARGLKAGLITQEQHDKIVSAIDAKAIPPWKTALGGEIMIHGDAESREDTHGCIALFNKDMDELYAKVNEGTKVIIKP